ncbi:MAG: aldo/keto reductase [Nitrosomonadales bacterium]|nr:aldo/keto reductase [Nitrosomonadales bacterium]
MVLQRPYGNSGLMVSPLGLGAMQIGDPGLDEAQAATLLNAALDAGITLIDTARSYGLSEARIGRHLAARRDGIVLSTKLGYGVEGYEDWTGSCITAGIERALRLLRTDRIDIAHLHSCPCETLERGEVIAALEQAKRDGKVRAIAYSGDNDDLVCAVATGRFDGFMASLNICDQRVIDAVLSGIATRGFIAKRPAANHPWRFSERPAGDYCEEYWLRWRAMALSSRGHEWGEVALRFALTPPQVSSAITGTANIAHLRQDVAWAMAGGLDEDWFGELRTAFRQHDRDWAGQV